MIRHFRLDVYIRSRHDYWTAIPRSSVMPSLRVHVVRKFIVQKLRLERKPHEKLGSVVVVVNTSLTY